MAQVNIDSASLIARAKGILLKPADEWPVIKAETTSSAAIFTGYVVPLAAIGPVCQFIHGQLFGIGMFGFSYHPGLISGLAGAVVSYVLALVGVYVLALIANALAPNFGGQSNRDNAMKLIAYGATASFVAGVFSLLPGLGVLGLLGLYSFYLFYTGAGPMMAVPQDKALTYTLVTLVCAVVLSVVVSAVSMPVVSLFGGGAMSGSLGSNDVTGKIGLPGGGSVDLGQAKQAADQMAAAASGKKTPIAPSALQELLPAAIGSYTRTAVESSAMGGVGSTAEGTYTSGSNSYHLKVADMAAIGAIAGLGAAMGVEENKQDADSYEKTGTVDGHLQNESWNKTSSSGKFGMIVGNRFSIDAEGSAASVDDLKAAVATIDQGKLASLAH
ncbi:Yip1 family protein [Novosphingobium sp.]|uniref:Yip1 family protein n=1 Tax=Novosphingobium sp. TaxID=1874826 RepID=UPI00334172C5